MLILHFVDLHGILKGIGIFVEQSWGASQAKADCRSIWPLEVPQWAQKEPILASNKDVFEDISKAQFGRHSIHTVLDDESYQIVEGTIEASEGIRVNMIIHGVLWRPGKSCMTLYLTGNECFLVTTPIGDPTKFEKGSWVNGPALHPVVTSLARYSMITSG